MVFVVLAMITEVRRRALLQEFFLALGLIVGAASLCWLGPLLPLPLTIALWGALLTSLVVLLRRRFQQLVGPVFFYDLVRTARRGQQIAHRCLYAGLLLLVLMVLYWLRYPFNDLEGLMRPVRLRPAEVSDFGSYFFHAFMILQFSAVVLVTPAYTATAIAEEKERRTLEFLLATDLSSREVVLGMLGARLANLGLLVFTGMPVLGMLQLLGGVDPDLVLAGFLATFMAMVSVGSLSILVSVHARSALGAVVQTYAWMLMLLPMAACVSPALACGGLAYTNTPSAFVVTILLVFSVVQGVVALLCCRWAIRELRPAALGTSRHREFARERPGRAQLPRPAESEPPQTQNAEPAHWTAFPDAAADLAARGESLRRSHHLYQRLPPVGDDALRWKEIHAEKRLMPADSVGFLIAAAAMVVLTQVMGTVAMNGGGRDSVSAGAKQLVHPWGTVLLFLLLFQVGLSAASRVSRERERQTLDGLLTLPISAEEILFAKWLGSIWSGRWMLACLGVIWGLGVVTTGISVASLPLLAAAAVVYVTFVATLSLWFSTANRTTLRSTLLTTLATLVIVLGPGIVVRMGGVDWSRPQSGGTLDWPALIGEYALTPSATLRALTFRDAEFEKGDPLTPTVRVLAAVGGLHLYMLSTGLLWLSIRAHFQAEKGPRPMRRPPGSE